MNYTHKFMNLDNYFGENLFKIEGENEKEKKKWRKENKNWASKSGMEEQNARDEKQGNDYFTITGLFLHGFSYYSPP